MNKKEIKYIRVSFFLEDGTERALETPFYEYDDLTKKTLFVLVKLREELRLTDEPSND